MLSGEGCRELVLMVDLREFIGDKGHREVSGAGV